jgi:hypothetical protein
MKNFKMLLPEKEVKTTMMSEIDSTFIFTIFLNDGYSIKEYLRKIKENKSVNLYTEHHHFFINEVDRKQIIELLDVEVIAFSLEENSFMLKIHEFDFRNVADVRKEKIKALLK